MPTTGNCDHVEIHPLLSHLIITTTPRADVSVHFRDEKTEAWRDPDTSPRSPVEVVLSDLKLVVACPHETAQFPCDRLLVLELDTIAVLSHQFIQLYRWEYTRQVHR